MAERRFRTPELLELIEWLKTHDYAHYHAPMDSRPCTVKVRQYTVSNVRPELSRATIWTDGTGPLVVNLAKHLDRFRLPVTDFLEVPGVQCLRWQGLQVGPGDHRRS
jgi:hypothetical protein